MPFHPLKILRNRRSPQQEAYCLEDIIDRLEFGDNLVDEDESNGRGRNSDKPQWLRKRFTWVSSSIRMKHSKQNQLLQEALARNAFQDARLLIEDWHVSLEDKNKTLLALCEDPCLMFEHKLTFARLLIDYGASTEYKDDKGRTALHVCYDNYTERELTRMIMAHADVDAPDEKGNTVMHKAIIKNDAKTLRRLLSLGANPNLLDAQGRPPLVLASHVSGNSCLRILLDNGANFRLKDKNGRSALASIENPAAWAALLELGLRSDTRDTDGVAPLHMAFGLWCRWRRGDMLSEILFQRSSLLDLVVKKAKSINLRDRYGRTVLHYACEVPHDPAPKYVKALVQKGAFFAADSNGWTPLHVAVAAGNYATAASLVELGADVEARDSRGRTPLHVIGLDQVASKKFPDENDPMDAIRLVAFGKDAPAPIFAAPPSDLSLEICSTLDNDSTPLISQFLQSGFDFRALDKNGNMPFFFATNSTMHYEMLHAAACQGLFG